MFFRVFSCPGVKEKQNSHLAFTLYLERTVILFYLLNKVMTKCPEMKHYFLNSQGGSVFEIKAMECFAI